MDEATTTPIYRASVPVLAGVLDRLAAELGRAETQLGTTAFTVALEQRPAAGMMPACRQVATAVQFALRTAFPLAGKKAPELRHALDGPGLLTRIAEARRRITALKPAAFEGAETRVIRVQAGFADLELTGEAYLHEFGLPNLYFHQAMAHVALKQAGARLGKADFDGRHDYPEGFSFG